MKRILSIILATCLNYLFWSWVVLDFNPVSWEPELRFLFGMIEVFIVLLICSYVD